MMNKTVFLKRMLFLGFMGISLYAAGAAAAVKTGNGAFDTAYEALYVTFLNARQLVYIASGFGLIGVAVGGIFGKVSFKWLAMICIALAILAGADKIIDYSISNGVDIDKDYRGIGDDDLDLDLQFKD